jgi:hypothetical protein
MHLGFDRSAYPGDDVMQSLWDSTPLTWVAPYLAPAPSYGDEAWMTAMPALRAMGWGFAPVYVGQQSPGGPGTHLLTGAQGQADAHQAASLAAAAGFENGSVLYLDIEIGGDLPANHLAYVKSWVTEVQVNTVFWAGVYCSFSRTAAQVNAECGDVPTWVFHPLDPGPSTIDLSDEAAPDPARSGFATALGWQYRMSLAGPVDLTWVDADTGQPHRLPQVDLNAAWCLDPSNPYADWADAPPGPSGRSGRSGRSVAVRPRASR